MIKIKNIKQKSGLMLFFDGFYDGMKSFGAAIIAITNFILLLPVYILGVGLVSLIARIVGKHFLNIKKEKKKTYWDDKTERPKFEDFYRQF